MKNKKGQIGDIILFLFFFSFVIYFITAFISSKVFFISQNAVNSIVESKVDIVRTKGIFTESEYQDLYKRLARYGNFDVYVTLEKQEETGAYTTIFMPKEIIDQPLHVGDFIKIYVESKQPAVFSKILSSGLLMGSKKQTGGFKLKSLATGMIATDGSMRGLEVINLINKYTTAPYNLTIKVDLIDYSAVGNADAVPELIPCELKKGYVRDSAHGIYTYDQPYKEPAPYDNSVTKPAPKSLDPNSKFNGWIDPEGKFKVDIQRDTITGIVIGIAAKQVYESMR
jgi:hypothetical protein